MDKELTSAERHKKVIEIAKEEAAKKKASQTNCAVEKKLTTTGGVELNFHTQQRIEQTEKGVKTTTDPIVAHNGRRSIPEGILGRDRFLYGGLRRAHIETPEGVIEAVKDGRADIGIVNSLPESIAEEGMPIVLAEIDPATHKLNRSGPIYLVGRPVPQPQA